MLYLSAEKQKAQRTFWTTEENKALEEAFKFKIQEKRNISKQDIAAAKERYACLARRSEAVMRAKVNNIIKGKDKKFVRTNRK